MNEKQKVTIVINGKEYEVEMWHNEVEKVIAAAEHKPFTGYEKMEEGDYYYVSQCDDIGDNPNDSYYADIHYDNANYYSDRAVAANNLRADFLMRQIRRFAAMNGGIVAPMHMMKFEKEYKREVYYFISCTRDDEKVVCCELNNYNWPRFGLIVFYDKEACEKCIKTFHDELLWYFTEYEPQRYEED